LDKAGFGKYVYTENFLWYLDNILGLRGNDIHLISGVDMVDTVDMFLRDNHIDFSPERIRQTLFEKKKTLVTEGQLCQLSQLGGRNTELMFLCFALSNLVKVECDDEIVETFTQKITEESERTELGYRGILKQVLMDLWNEKKGNEDYMTEDGFVKISNKEIYDKYNQVLKKEYGEGVSPVKFKEFMLEFGFTDALNRTKLKVPIPGDLEPKSRLCNVFTERVLRKLGVEEERQTLQEILIKTKDWILKNKDADSLIDLFSLTEYVASLTEEKPSKIINVLKNDGLLFDVGKPGKAGVK
jgi:hypothetical protein